jgi:hypothetical protein
MHNSTIKDLVPALFPSKSSNAASIAYYQITWCSIETHSNHLVFHLQFVEQIHSRIRPAESLINGSPIIFGQKKFIQ